MCKESYKELDNVTKKLRKNTLFDRLDKFVGLYYLTYSYKLNLEQLEKLQKHPNLWKPAIIIGADKRFYELTNGIMNLLNSFYMLYQISRYQINENFDAKVFKRYKLDCENEFKERLDYQIINKLRILYSHYLVADTIETDNKSKKIFISTNFLFNKTRNSNSKELNCYIKDNEKMYLVDFFKSYYDKIVQDAKKIKSFCISEVRKKQPNKFKNIDEYNRLIREIRKVNPVLGEKFELFN
ncbi:MAG: hypothetical protein K9L74_06340 [Candidatus Izimaplasma sp.]|nr:hypothetical protein [Candidatus Izimaplasma bacterium]